MRSEKNAPVSGDNKKRGQVLREMIAKNAPVWLILARYVWPLLAPLTFFVLGWFYNVRAARGGMFYRISTWRLLANTIAGTHEYLGGETVEVKTWFYGILSAIAILCFLAFLLSLFFSVLSAYTALRAFRAGHESEESNRMKLIFKVAFPNRLGLFLPELFILLPAAYPYLYSFVSSRFLMMGGETVIYVFSNPPLIVVSVMLIISLALALAIPRYERRKKMNMFLLWHEDTVPEEEA